MYLFPVGVLGLGVMMLVAHRNSWRRAQTRRLSPADWVYRHQQFRRRMQASSLLAMIGPTMLVGLRVSPQGSPRTFIALWIVVLLATSWILWLALADALASSRHFYRLSRERAHARGVLRTELDRLAARRQSGESRLGTTCEAIENS